MPMRAIGVKWLKVDPGAAQARRRARRAGEDRAAPDAVDPGLASPAPAPASEAYVTVAAVDVGILNLTRYEAPDPEGWYFGQRMLGLEMRDLYGRLIDGSLGATGRLRTGGDGAGMPPQGSPPTEKLVAFFSGPVRLDADGKATVSFDIPQFNGTVRVMTVAWTKEAVGHASAGRDRARSDRGHRQPAALPGARRRRRACGSTSPTPTVPPATTRSRIDDDRAISSTGALPDKLTLAGGKRAAVTVPLIADRRRRRAASPSG